MEPIFYQICPRCQGTGNPGLIYDENGDLIQGLLCVTCNGDKYIPTGKTAPDSELHTKTDNLQNDMDKALKRLKKILQNLDAWEEDD